MPIRSSIFPRGVGWTAPPACCLTRSRRACRFPELRLLVPRGGLSARGCARTLRRKGSCVQERNGRRDKTRTASVKLSTTTDLTGLFWTKLCEKLSWKGTLVMPKKRFSAEQIVVLLRQIEVLMSQGKVMPVACREAGISQQSYYRWRKEYGGLELDQAKLDEGPGAGECPPQASSSPICRWRSRCPQGRCLGKLVSPGNGAGRRSRAFEGSTAPPNATPAGSSASTAEHSDTAPSFDLMRMR